MKRESFLELVREVLDSLPWRFRKHIINVAVVVEDRPPAEKEREHVLMGLFEGIRRTEQSFFNVAAGPNRIVLYQKNIEAHAETVAAHTGSSVEDARGKQRCQVIGKLVISDYRSPSDPTLNRAI